MTEVVRVVSGACFGARYQNTLMGLRKPQSARPGLWEWPGGKIEPNETPRQALAREWREELGVEITVGELIDISQIELEHVYVIYLYEVRMTDPDRARPLDHVQLGWVDPIHAIGHMPCSPGVYVNFAALYRWMCRASLPEVGK